MNLEKCKEKYFVIVEGEERATIRDSLAAAEKKRKKLAKYSNGKNLTRRTEKYIKCWKPWILISDTKSIKWPKLD